MNLSGYVGHVTIFSWMFTIACCSVVGLRLGERIRFSFEVVMHTYLCYFLGCNCHTDRSALIYLAPVSETLRAQHGVVVLAQMFACLRSRLPTMRRPTGGPPASHRAPRRRRRSNGNSSTRRNRKRDRRQLPPRVAWRRRPSARFPSPQWRPRSTWCGVLRRCCISRIVLPDSSSVTAAAVNAYFLMFPVLFLRLLEQGLLHKRHGKF